jgi:HlyD family secretion protein
MKINPKLSKFLKWSVLAVVVGVVVYRVKFAPVPVTEHTVQTGPLVAEVMGTGVLNTHIKTTISPRIQERLAAVLVDQNDVVTNGQLLAQLDDGELNQQVAVADATLASAKATAARVRVDETRAKAVEQQARLDQQRATDLVRNKVSSQAELDKANEQLRVAEADIQRTQAAIGEAESQVIMAEKNLAYQNERLSYTLIFSPYDGLVTRRDIDPGGVVVPGSSILQLISTNEIWVSAWVDETAATGLRPGQPARVVFRSESARSYPGTVARLGRETDRETREFVVDVQVRELPANWTIGQRAEVYIETGRTAAALALPQQFVQWRAGKSGVFVNNGGAAHWRAVTLGLRGSEAVEVARGLAAGDQVVQPRDPKQELADGQRITTK